MYRTLVSAAAVDGEIGVAERGYLNGFRERIGLSARRAEAITRRAAEETATYFVPQDPVARARLFDDVARVMQADGKLSAKEKIFLRKIRARYTKGAPACPRCAVPMWMSKSRFGCRDCGGVWIPWRFFRIRSPHVHLERWLHDYRRSGTRQGGGSSHRCRECDRVLDELAFGGGEGRIFIEQCGSCRGVFVEVDQRQRIRALARDVAKLRAPRHLEAQMLAFIQEMARRLKKSTSRRGASAPRRTETRARTRSRSSSAR